MTGRIFNIQHFSIHDGAGIRTTVFMKGCNLRCAWCQNPESHDMEKQILFYASKCVGCGDCTSLCKKLFTTECIACGKCAEVCRHGARELCGKDLSADEVVDEILRDKKFYDVSGGGVTFSGGEPLLQKDFLLEVLQKCKAVFIHTIVETAANVPWSVFEEVLPYIDQVICDIKCIHPQKHILGTGVDNHNILENAKKLVESDHDVLFRTPLIVGYNDDEIGEIVKFIGKRRLELLPYHELAVGKYQALGKTYNRNHFAVPAKELMEGLVSQYPNVFYES